MEMFNKKVTNERIGDTMAKSETLFTLKEVEKYYLKQMGNYKTEASYDVIANELPYFKTLNYTEFAHCFITHPLQQELRVKQMVDAYQDTVAEEDMVDYISYFKSKIDAGTANKYQDMKNDKVYEQRDHLVVLVGSNKLKERLCLNKLKYISETFDDDVWFKPHPLTYHQLIGELMDLFGEKNILPRKADMYSFLKQAEVVHTSHMSESAIYAVSLGKEIDPIDVYNKVEQGSFYHINKFLFTEKNPQEWVNKTFSSYKSGVFNPAVDKDWRTKVDKYLEYIHEVRESYKNKYI